MTSTKISKSYGSVWAAGEILASPEPDGTYYALVCVEPLERGPKGGVKRPAKMAEIRGDTAEDIRRGVRSLGFIAPRAWLA